MSKARGSCESALTVQFRRAVPFLHPAPSSQRPAPSLRKYTGPVRLSSFLLAVSLTVQAPAVDWQRLPLDSYPPEARTQIAGARDAAVRPAASGDAFGQLALVLHAWEQFDLAAAAYAEARRLASSTADWWVFSGMLASRVARHDLAAEYFREAVRLSPSPVLALRYADALLESGQLDAARDAYVRAATFPAAEPGARYGLGRVAQAAGDVETARTAFEQAIALAPTFGAAHYALAQLQRKAGNLDAARESLVRQQRCLACWPVPDDPWSRRLGAVRTDAAAAMRRGIELAGAPGADADAIALHQQALARDPGLIQARVNLITLYARTGNLAASEAEYRAVVATGLHLAEAHRSFGLALLTLGEGDKAEPVLLLAVDANPLDAAALNGLGLIAEQRRRPLDAEAYYRRAVEAEPTRRGFRFNRVRTLVALDRLDEALSQLATMHAPDDAEAAQYAFATSALYVRKGDLASGRRWGEEALARARKHGLTDFAAAIERDLAKIR